MKPEDRAARRFREAFGAEPAAVATAPGRINLIGEHVDYHGGHVLPCATAERTAVAVGPWSGLSAVSEQAPESSAAWPPAATGRWTDYVAGIASLLGTEGAPFSPGLAAAVASDLPMGAGLSSSAALEVATALALLRWSGRAAPSRAVAELAWRAENEFCGMPCGQMDQLAVTEAPAGQAILLDCRTLTTRAVPVGADLVLADTGEPHTLRASAYAERRQEGVEALARLRPEFPALLCLVDLPPARLPAVVRRLPPPLDLRVRHVVNENQRAVLAAGALERGDLAAFGGLMNASHDSLRELYACSTARLDAVVATARGLPGVLGARLVGAGWGGAVLVAAEPGSGGEVAARLGAAAGVDQARAVGIGAGAMAGDGPAG